MKKLISFLLLLFLVVSCAMKPKESKRVSAFLVERKEYYPEQDAKFERSYGEYLISVEDLYQELKIGPKFDSYLNSLRNTYQLLAHAENVLPLRFTRETGRKVSQHPRDFKIYQARTLRSQRVRLNADREQKILNEIGPENFSRLKENHNKYDPDFPL